MVDETDGIDEAIEGELRLLVSAAAQAGERFARAHADSMRRAQAKSEREARELQSRFEAEQHAVRANLQGVQRDDWWEQATPQAIAQAYESAVAWRQYEPAAAQAERRITDELRTRHGITPDQLRAQVAAERGETPPARYVLTERDRDRTSKRDITRDDALAVIDRMPPAGDLTPSRRERFEDLRGWIGQDHTVDVAIAAKFPQLMDKQHRQAVRDAEVERQRATHYDQPQPHAEQPPREPRFDVYKMVNEGDALRNLGKAGALERIESTAGTELSTEPRQLGYDMRRWIGRDAEVDYAIFAKHPEILTDDEKFTLLRDAAAWRRDDELVEAGYKSAESVAEWRADDAVWRAREAEKRDREEVAALMVEADVEESRAERHRQDSGPDAEVLTERHEDQAQDAREDAKTAYDSAERRHATAAELESQGHDPETVDIRMRADVSQGAPPREATRGSRSPQARKGKGRGNANRHRDPQRTR